jgi:CubicO group peptidase (beta-lactamase class C family)
MRKILFLLSFAIIFNATAQNSFNVQKMDSLFASIESHNRGMGSLALLKNGKIIYTKAIGASHFKGENAVAATPETRYRVGSITKMFTATLIFQLIEQKKLTLATPLDQFFADIPNAKKITIGLMLNHRSGIFNITEAEDYDTWSVEKQTRETMTQRMATQTPAFAPDEKSEYSNSNYILLGYIAEMLTNQPLKNLISERICEKIGLKNTYIGETTDVGNNECFSYSFTGKQWIQETETNMTVPAGAGAIVATASDLAVFLDALFAGKLVSNASLEQMKTMNQKFGFGLFVFPFNEKKSFGHTGGIDGFSSMATYFPSDSLAVVYCGNGKGFERNNILLGVLKIYFNNPYEIPTFEKKKGIDTDLQQYVGLYTSDDIPLKIRVENENGNLTAQATGQSAFPLEAVEKHQFVFETAGIRMNFDPEKSEMTLLQGGATYQFKKEK